MKRVVAAAIILLVTVSGARAGEEGFATIVEALATPVFFDSDQLKKSHSDTVVMLRMEIARQRLMGLKTWPGDLAKFRDTFLFPLETCHSSVENQRALNQRMPDFEGMARSLVDAAPGLDKAAKKQKLNRDDQMAVDSLAIKAASEIIGGLVNAYEASAERDAYQKAYRTLRKDAVRAIRETCPAQYKGTEKARVKALDVQFSGSWNNTFTNDVLSLRNDTGEDLTNCTILVSLAGYNAASDAKESDSHLHYVAKWPAGKWLYASYPSRTRGGIATNESVDSIESVSVTLYSNQCLDRVNYTYQGKDYDEDVERWAKNRLKGKFTGKWFSYQNHGLHNNGFKIWYEGKSSFPVRFITVRAKQGGTEKAIRWRIGARKMNAGDSMWLSHEDFNGLDDPENVVLDFEFPRSSYTYKVTWGLRDIWNFDK
jgi:hypothetical protein